MNKTFRIIFPLLLLTFLIIVEFTTVLAQNAPPLPKAIPRVVGIDFKTPKIPGAKVRGRLVYEDSGLPFRYAVFGLVKTDQKTSTYGTTFVRTDENGDFLLEDVKQGEYYPYVKNDGVLNPDAYHQLNRFDKDSVKPEEIFQKIKVAGMGEFQIFVRAKRGGSVSGVVKYFDGESAVGVKVEALRMVGDKFLSYPVGNVKTDDRGYYRFPALPEGTYTVRVIEPISHSNEQIRYYSSEDNHGMELLKTYYPQGQTATEANSFELFLGQEQTSINITLSERSLFDVSGRVVLKSTGQPLKNFKIRFYPLIEKGDEGLTSGNAGVRSGSDVKTGMSLNDADIPSEWKFRSLPKGKYRITASQIRSYGKNAKNKPKYPDVSKDVEIIDGDIDNLILEIPVSSIIRGVVVSENGKPLPNYLRIYGANLDNNNFAFAEFEEPGKPEKNVTRKFFAIAKLTAGKIKLRMSGRQFYIHSVSVGGRTVENETVEIGEGETLENVQIVIGSEMGTLRGKVKNFDSEKRVGILLIDPKQGFEPSFFGDVKKNGTYEIKAKPGEYKVVIWSNQRQPQTREEAIKMKKEMMEKAPTVTIKLNEVSDLDIDMPS